MAVWMRWWTEIRDPVLTEKKRETNGMDEVYEISSSEDERKEQIG